ncbi:MAG: hypothetical protein Q4D30_03655 [Bacteroidales bacterium]|nr:hypothetical protein [Bacteroidales bacterium]
MDFKTLIPANDILSKELENVFGGAEPVKEIVCKSDGIVEIPATKAGLAIF